jgi:hypothetical protein
LIRTCLRASAIAAVALTATLTMGTAAFAHTKVIIDNPRADATNVTMTMTAEAESHYAGVASVHVVLPAGVTASQITLISGPNGWKLRPVTDGYTVAGPALPVHAPVATVTRIAQLPPTATELVFKTLVTYSDGQIDRWIELPTATVPNPDHPAATVILQPPAATSPPTPESASPQAAAATAPATATQPTPQSAAATGSTSRVWKLIGAAVAVAAAGVTALLVFRRRVGK